jgi:hypothetical protein
MEHASRASKSERVQGANHRFRDCRQIELATEASKRDRVQTTDSETIDTVKLSRCCVYEEAVVLLNPGQEEIARALPCLRPGANRCCCHWLEIVAITNNKKELNIMSTDYMLRSLLFVANPDISLTSTQMQLQFRLQQEFPVKKCNHKTILWNHREMPYIIIP